MAERLPQLRRRCSLCWRFAATASRCAMGSAIVNQITEESKRKHTAVMQHAMRSTEHATSCTFMQAPAAPRDVLGSAAVVLATAAALPSVPPHAIAGELAAGLFPAMPTEARL